MFEEYIEDAYFFATEAGNFPSEREQKRMYRASVFCASAAIESFVNYVADTFDKGDALATYERAFLLDKKFGIQGGKFAAQDVQEFHRLDEKLRLLLEKFCPAYELATEQSWSRYRELRDLRDAIAHPRQDEDELSADDYRSRLKRGLQAILNLINTLCLGIFSKPLRKRLLDLTV